MPNALQRQGLAPLLKLLHRESLFNRCAFTTSTSAFQAEPQLAANEEPSINWRDNLGVIRNTWTCAFSQANRLLYPEPRTKSHLQAAALKQLGYTASIIALGSLSNALCSVCRREEVGSVFNTPLLDLLHDAARVHRMYNDPQMVSAGDFQQRVARTTVLHDQISDERREEAFCC